MSLSKTLPPTDSIHPDLFQSIFNPDNRPNSFTTPNFDLKQSHEKALHHFSVGQSDTMSVYMPTVTTENDNVRLLKIEAPHATMETDNFLYKGALVNGKRHAEQAFMLAMANGDWTEFDQEQLMVAKFECAFEEGKMTGDKCRVEWYKIDKLEQWAQVAEWWQDNVRQFESTFEQDVERINAFLEENGTLDATYTGSFRHGLKHGRGELCWIQSGNRYNGEFSNGKRHGKGVMEWPSKAERYDGEWVEGLPHGEGKLYLFNVEVGSCNYYEGHFQNGTKYGKGAFFYGDGTKFEGEFVRNERHGYGEFYYVNGVVDRGYYEHDRKVRDIGNSSKATPQSSTQSETGSRPRSRGRASSRASSPGSPGRRPNSAVSATSKVTTRKRAMSRKSSRKNKLAAKDLQVSNNQQFDNIPFYIDDLLMHTDYDSSEVKALWSALTRFAPKLQEIYNHYSLYGAKKEAVLIQDSADGSNVKRVNTKFSKHNDLSLHQFWKFAKDCGLISLNNLSLAVIDRIFMKTSLIASRPDIRNVFESNAPPKLSVLMRTPNTNNIHSPENRIRFREFCEALFRIAYTLHHSYDKKKHVPLQKRFQQTLEEVIFPHFDTVDEKEQESLFLRDDPAFSSLIERYQEKLLSIFQEYATLQSHNIRDNNLYLENDATITVRQFLRLLDTKDFIDHSLPLIQVMNVIDAESTQSTAPLIVERELIFEEFLECLIKCGLHKFESYMNGKPRESAVEATFEWLLDDERIDVTSTTSNEDNKETTSTEEDGEENATNTQKEPESNKE